MKTALLAMGGLLCMCAWQANANADDTNANPTPTAQETAINSEGPTTGANSMSGGPAALHAKTREEVYQELVRSQHDGEAARIQELYRGN
ncbi:hypothetical protein [Paraburkholderia sp.]|jgi:hypothetical protein|uniref:hypothetical protein n=1 Tax=Paraburkholderia sp. TaxID=1926495 RepID=UPI002F41B178